MKKLFRMSICLFVVSWVLGQGVWAEEGGSPKLVVDQTEHDFGEVKEGDAIEHTFRLLNKGDQPLMIEKVQPG